MTDAERTRKLIAKLRTRAEQTNQFVMEWALEDAADMLQQYLDEASDRQWQYGWKSFLPDGEEYEWLDHVTREEAEAEIAHGIELEKTSTPKEDRLTYKLVRRRVVEPGPWEEVPENE